MTDKRTLAIEEEIRLRRVPSIENLLHDVEERPGYHFLGFKSLFSRNPEMREWRNVVWYAIREKRVERDIFGKFWIYGTKPPLSDLILEWWDLNGGALKIIGLVALLGIIIGVTAVMFHPLREAYGWLAYGVLPFSTFCALLTCAFIYNR
jgi:hypothetical protein